MADAVAIVLDVGVFMNQAPPGDETPLQTALTCIQMILQRKIFAESKDEVALILFGTSTTANDLSGDGYKNITLAKPLSRVSWPLIEYVHNNVHASDTTADFLDAMVVASDHLMKATRGKKGISSKSIALFSNLAGEFADELCEEIVTGLKNSGVDLTVIGPSLSDDDEGSSGANRRGAAAGHDKAKSKQQIAGEMMIKRILDEVSGECYSFREALPALSFFQKKSVKQVAWKCPLEIGGCLTIPVCLYTKVSEAKTKSMKKVYAKNSDTEIRHDRTYHLNDEAETEVEQRETIQGHRYGNTLVPFSDEDKERMKFTADKCLKVLGFSKNENIKRHHYMGGSVYCCVPEPGDQAATVALSALIQALYEMDSVAVVRRVYANRSTPRLGVLTPHIKAAYQCLLYTELPFAEDLRHYTFSSLPLHDDVPDNVKKSQPSEEQLKVIDDLIEELNLCPTDENGETEEYVKPKLTFNPYRQRLYQCILHRGLNPDDPLPDLNPLVAQSLRVPQDILTRSETTQERMRKLFKLETIVEKKEEKTGQAVFNNSTADEPDTKRMRIDERGIGDAITMANLAAAKVTEIGSVRPVEDFRALIADRDVDRFDEACKSLMTRTTEMIVMSFGNKSYAKASECIKVLREECVRHSEPIIFNDFLKELKALVVSKHLAEFRRKMVDDSLTLISQTECPSSTVTAQAASTFLSEDTADISAPMQGTEDDEADDLLELM